jgi:hypothetical protein
MNSPTDDSRFARLFACLKEHDRRSALSFEEVLEGRRTLLERLLTLPAGMKLMATALLAIVVLSPLILIWHGGGETDLGAIDSSALAIVQWDSPTDFLMESDDEFLTDMPSIGDDLSDWLQADDDLVAQ